MKKILFILFILVGLMGSANTYYYIENTGYYSFVLDKQHKIPVITSYISKPSTLIKNTKRYNIWKQFNEYRQHQATNRDYGRSGFDKGHLVPSADLLYNKEANKSTFMFVNCVPQYPKMNRIIWRKLEKHVRDLTKKSDSCIIYTGTKNISNKYIGDYIYIPNTMFKLVFKYKGAVIDTLLWVMPNKNTYTKYNKYNDYKISNKDSIILYCNYIKEFLN